MLKNKRGAKLTVLVGEWVVCQYCGHHIKSGQTFRIFKGEFCHPSHDIEENGEANHQKETPEGDPNE